MNGARGFTFTLVVVSLLALAGGVGAQSDAPVECPPWGGDTDGTLKFSREQGWPLGMRGHDCTYAVDLGGTEVDITLNLRWDPPERGHLLAPLSCWPPDPDRYTARSDTHHASVNARHRGDAPAGLEAFAAELVSVIEPLAARCSAGPADVSAAPCPAFEPEDAVAWTLEERTPVVLEPSNGEAHFSCVYAHPDEDVEVTLTAGWQAVPMPMSNIGCLRPGAEVFQRYHAGESRAQVTYANARITALPSTERGKVNAAADEAGRELLAAIEGRGAPCLTPTFCPRSLTLPQGAVPLAIGVGPVPDTSGNHPTDLTYCHYSPDPADPQDHYHFEVHTASLDVADFWPCQRASPRDDLVTSATHPVLVDVSFSATERTMAALVDHARELVTLAEATVGDCSGEGVIEDRPTGEHCPGETDVGASEPWPLIEEKDAPDERADVTLRSLTCIYAPDPSASGGFLAVHAHAAEEPDLDGPWACAPGPMVGGGDSWAYQHWDDEVQASARHWHTLDSDAAADAVAEVLLAEVGKEALPCEEICPIALDIGQDVPAGLEAEALEEVEASGYELARLRCTYMPAPGEATFDLDLYWAEEPQASAFGCNYPGAGDQVAHRSRQLVAEVNGLDASGKQATRPAIEDVLFPRVEARAILCNVICPLQLDHKDGGDPLPLQAQRNELDEVHDFLRPVSDTVCIYAHEQGEVSRLVMVGDDGRALTPQVTITLVWRERPGAVGAAVCGPPGAHLAPKGGGGFLFAAGAQATGVWAEHDAASAAYDASGAIGAVLDDLAAVALPCVVHCPEDERFVNARHGVVRLERRQAMMLACDYRLESAGATVEYYWSEHLDVAGPVACGPLVSVRDPLAYKDGIRGHARAGPPLDAAGALADMGSRTGPLRGIPVPEAWFIDPVNAAADGPHGELLIPCIEQSLVGTPCITATERGAIIGILRSEGSSSAPAKVRYPDGQVVPLSFGHELREGDVVLTGEHRAQWQQHPPGKPSERSLVVLAPHSAACLMVPPDLVDDLRRTVATLAFGTVEVSEEDLQNFRLWVNGQRIDLDGTTVRVLHDPASATTSVLVNDGSVTSAIGETTQTATAGQGLLSVAGHLFAPMPLATGQWSALDDAFEGGADAPAPSTGGGGAGLVSDQPPREPAPTPMAALGLDTPGPDSDETSPDGPNEIDEGGTGAHEPEAGASTDEEEEGAEEPEDDAPGPGVLALVVVAVAAALVRRRR